MANVRNNGSRLLSLPTELLDKITSYLSPATTDDRESETSFRDFLVRHNLEAAAERAAWKEDLKAIRRSCRLMSNLRAVKAALFYDFYLYVSRKSLKNFEDLSEHGDLRHYVRRVVFMQPQAPGEFLDDQGRDTSEFRPRFRSVLEDDASQYWRDMLSCILPDCLDAYLVARWMHPRVNALHDSDAKISKYRDLYQQIVDEQHGLLDSGIYNIQVQACLSRCPNINSVILSNRDGSISATCWGEEAPHFYVHRQKSWLQRRHPHVGLNSAIQREEREERGLQTDTSFQTAVFDIIWGSGLSIKNLTIMQTTLWPANLNLCQSARDSLKKSFSGLQKLRVTVEAGSEAYRRGLGDPLPIIRESLHSLKALYLGVHIHNGHEDQAFPTLENILDLHFDKLEEVHLWGPAYKVKANWLAKCLRTNRTLREVEVRGISKSDVLDEWRTLASALHESELEVRLTLHDIGWLGERKLELTSTLIKQDPGFIERVLKS